MSEPKYGCLSIVYPAGMASPVLIQRGEDYTAEDWDAAMAYAWREGFVPFRDEPDYSCDGTSIWVLVDAGASPTGA